MREHCIQSSPSLNVSTVPEAEVPSTRVFSEASSKFYVQINTVYALKDVQHSIRLKLIFQNKDEGQ